MTNVAFNKNLELKPAYGLQDWFVRFYDEKKGIIYQRKTTNDDERAIVNDLAKCVYAGNKVCDTTQKQLINWVKKGEQLPFVYVLVTEFSYDYETEQKVDCFRTKAAAKKEMKANYKAELPDWKDKFAKDFLENGCDDDSAYIQESGDFTRNHITWTIYPKEIQ